MAEGDKAIEGTSRSSLRILGSVGEPINLKHGNGSIRRLVIVVAQLLIHGGKQKLAAL